MARIKNDMDALGMELARGSEFSLVQDALAQRARDAASAAAALNAALEAAAALGAVSGAPLRVGRHSRS
jgi:hypothetical protein